MKMTPINVLKVTLNFLVWLLVWYFVTWVLGGMFNSVIADAFGDEHTLSHGSWMILVMLFMVSRVRFNINPPANQPVDPNEELVDAMNPSLWN